MEIVENAASKTNMPIARKIFVLALVPFHSPKKIPNSVEKNTVEDITTAKEM